VNDLLFLRPPFQSEIPNSWKFSEVKYLYDILLGKMLQPEPRRADDREVPYLRAANVQWDGVHLDDLQTMYASDEEINSSQVMEGDLLVCEGGEVGRAAILKGEIPPDTIIQNALHRVRGKNGNNVGFLRYMLQHIASKGWFDVICNRATIAHFTGEKFGELRIAYPEPAMQAAIADYLDRETAKLDSTISAKHSLLNLLAEKRRALISQAVTKGLDSSVKMKDSGIPWLGEIPSHWSMVTLRRLITSLDQGWSPVASNQPANINEFGVLKLSAVKSGRLIYEENKALAFDADIPTELIIREGDILLTRANTPKLVGDVAIAKSDHNNLIFSDLIYRLRVCLDKVEPEWLILVLQSDIGRGQIEAEAKGSSNSMVKLAQNQVLGLLITNPPKAEQKIIIDFVQAEIYKLTNLISSTELTINLLQERRITLISELVTGQLSVENCHAHS